MDYKTQTIIISGAIFIVLGIVFFSLNKEISYVFLGIGLLIVIFGMLHKKKQVSIGEKLTKEQIDAIDEKVELTQEKYAGERKIRADLLKPPKTASKPVSKKIRHPKKKVKPAKKKAKKSSKKKVKKQVKKKAKRKSR